VMDS